MKIKDEDSLIHSLKALKIIQEAKKSNSVDLRKIEKRTPFFIVPIVANINKYPGKKILFPKDQFKLFYLEVISFPHCSTSITTSKKSYTPLYRIDGNLGKGEENEEILNQLEEIIIESFGLKENYQLLMSIFNELICNIQQHSESNFNCIQAQMYEGKLAISLLDSGITIQNSYRKAGFKQESSDEDLFKLAFEGVSTKDDKTRGTGIPNTFNWICNGLKGNLVIISNNMAFKKLEGEKIEFVDLEPLSLKFEGTIINMLFEIPTEKIDIYPLINKPIVYSK